VKAGDSLTSEASKTQQRLKRQEDGNAFLTVRVMKYEISPGEKRNTLEK